MVKVKFCGIRRTEDIEAVNRLKPDLHERAGCCVKRTA